MLPVTAAARAALLGHRSAVLWLTGLSGAGKSTLAAGLEKRLFGQRILPVVLDGDALRTGVSRGLQFSKADRDENIRRAGETALLLAQAGAVVIAALISPFQAARQQIRERARQMGIAFAEVYVNAPLAECERRDPKSLYRRARAGEIRGLTGIDSPYETPAAPELELRTDHETVAESLDKLSELALRLVCLPRPAPSTQEARS